MDFGFSCKKFWDFVLFSIVLLMLIWVIKIRDFRLPLIFVIIVPQRLRSEVKLNWWQQVVDEWETIWHNATFRGVEICPQCFSYNVIKKDKADWVRRKFRRFMCRNCKPPHKFREYDVPGLELPSFMVDFLLNARLDGDGAIDSANHARRDCYAIKYPFPPSEKVMYNVENKVLDELLWLENLVEYCLLEGVALASLQFDEIFQKKRHLRELAEAFLQWDLANTSDEGCNRTKKDEIFYYVITAKGVNPNHAMIPMVASSRDKLAFLMQAYQVSSRLRNDPVETRCDDLAAAETAIKIMFPDSKLEVTPRTKAKKNKWWKLFGKTNHVENLNRMLRKTIQKGKKFSSAKMLQNAALLNYFYHLFLCEHESLGGKTCLQYLGLPWPSCVKTFSQLYLFARFVKMRASSSEIMRDQVSRLESHEGVLVIGLKGELLQNVRMGFASYAVCLNNTIPPSERDKILSDLFLHNVVRDVGYTKLVLPLEVINKTSNGMNETYLVIKGAEIGRHTIIVPLVKSSINFDSLAFGNIKAHAQRINEYYYLWDYEEMLHQTLKEAAERYARNILGLRQIPIWLWRVGLPRQVSEDEFHAYHQDHY
jgi:hypothetical protein